MGLVRKTCKIPVCKTPVLIKVILSEPVLNESVSVIGALVRHAGKAVYRYEGSRRNKVICNV